jgi:HEAT repeat protein
MSETCAGSTKNRDVSLAGFFARVIVALVLSSALVLWLLRILWDDSTQNQYIRALRAGGTEDRVFAARQLVELPRPEQAELVVSALIQSLGDENDEVRGASVTSLGAVVQQLLVSWKNSPAELKKREPLIAEASRATIKLLEDPNDDVRSQALVALLAIHFRSLPTPRGLPDHELILAGVASGELSTALVTCLDSKSSQVRAQAAQVLGSLGPLLSPDIPPELVAAIEDESEVVRERAARACASYKEGLTPLVPDLFARLERAQPPRRFPFWYCLEQGAADPTLVPFLRERLKSPSPDVRSAAAALLSRMGPKAVAATPELLTLLADPYVPGASPPGANPDPAGWAGVALSEFPPTAQIVAALTANLHSGVHLRSDLAADYLGRYGPAARTAIPELIRVFRRRLNKNENLYSIAGALSRLAPGTEYADESISLMIEALKSKNPNIRAGAGWQIGRFGPQAKAAIPLLKTLAEGLPPIQYPFKEALLAIEQPAGPNEDPARTTGTLTDGQPSR